MRLIHVDQDSLPSGRVVPYDFEAQPSEGIHYPASIAIVAPEDTEKAVPPHGWGRWEVAHVIQRRAKH
jgi:hypothetical protein